MLHFSPWELNSIELEEQSAAFDVESCECGFDNRSAIQQKDQVAFKKVAANLMDSECLPNPEMFCHSSKP